jgi:hypothetical protein
MSQLFALFRGVARASLVPALTALALAGCARMQNVDYDAETAFGTVSLSDRCVDIMRRAIPGVDIDVTDRKTTADVNATTIEIDANRRNVPANGAYAREIAAECTFAGGILNSFRWTLGPVLPPSAGPAR